MTGEHVAYVRLGVVTLWLLACAWYDWRTREVPNALTLPPFVLAWPASYLLYGLSGVWMTTVFFVGTYIMFQAGVMGPADGKILTALAGLAPEVMPGILLVHAAVAGYLRLAGRPNALLPGAVLYAAGVCAALLVELTGTGVIRTIWG